MYTSILALAALAASVLAQTPPGTSPSVTTPLGVQFGSTTVSPGLLLPTSAVQSQPIVSSNTRYEGNYFLIMMDLSIKASQVVTDASNTSAINSLTPGYGQGRTTRLHWFSGNLTQASNGSFVKNNASPDIAMYAGPHPPVGDIAHAYTLYLFPQPANYSVSALAASGAYYAASSMSRMNFSLAGAITRVGQPIAAEYFTSIASNSTNGTAPMTTSSPIATAAAGKLGVSSALAGLGALAFAILL